VRDLESSNDYENMFNTAQTLDARERVTLEYEIAAIMNGPKTRELRIDQINLIALARSGPGSDQFAVHGIRLTEPINVNQEVVEPAGIEPATSTMPL
jgi:hypothetical protein